MSLHTLLSGPFRRRLAARSGRELGAARTVSVGRRRRSLTGAFENHSSIQSVTMMFETSIKPTLTGGRGHSICIL